MSPHESLVTSMATDPRDWSVNETDAWMYGIVCGWGEALPSVATRHGWSDFDRDRLAAMHSQFAMPTEGDE